MSTPPRKKKSSASPSSPAPKAKARSGVAPSRKKAGAPSRGKKRAKKKASLLPQIVGGATLLALVGGVAAGAIYFTNQAIPEVQPVDAGPGERVRRPAVEATLPNRDVKRPGLAAHMPDEIYFPKALDVAGAPIEPPVQGLLGREVITVFADGKFRADEPVTRAQFVSWCYNAVMAQTVPGPDPFVPPKKGFKAVSGESFGDVPADHWAAEVLATVKASGVLGETTAYFRPDAPLSREEWLVLASAFAASADEKASLGRTPEASGATPVQVAYRALNFTDYEALKPAFAPHVAFVFGDEMRRSWVTTTFGAPTTPGPWQPGKDVTRGEAATWIGAAYEKIGEGIL